ncbi:cytochrome ubiquinol oxidase subunit II [Oricola nitratireducens]|uniref:cytochrome ubiquinol oxidase subunit II n=1 Tax=Oricola nitratireducens TaxID=2775868 RepID=UPI0018664CF2|nr:cytochrome ubiquinol oxidase subunit II [Oricola nitratireducens]
MNLHPQGRLQTRSTLWFLALASIVLLGGCSATDLPIIHPGSAVALSQRNLVIVVFGLMLIVLIPVWLMAAWFPWKYRAGGNETGYRPDWSQSLLIDAIVWAVPAILVMVIAAMVWIYTHRLDPYRPATGTGPPLEVQVVALDWKWLFIYPDQKVATVNELVVPAGRPVQLHITADTVMNSLFVPGLTGQIYAMAGMETRLNFDAEKPRDYRGRNTQYSGGQFPDQHFAVHVETQPQFARWAAAAAKSGSVLNQSAYDALSSRKSASGVKEFALADDNLFAGIIAKYCSDGGCRQASAASAR